jgi:hypothetical protein
MGYVADSGKDAGAEESMNWTLALALGIPSGSIILIVGLLLIGLWAGFAQGPAQLRATATHQTLAFPLPVVARPPTFAETVQDHATATRAAELAVPRDLDLLVAVRARPEMSADEVAAQATELARRLRCQIEVHYKGKEWRRSRG